MTLLSTAYFHPIEYMYYVLSENKICIEAQENFIKQTYRNRCCIVSANGALDLSVPLINEGNKTPITEKKISYSENWKTKHWRAIESTYNNSPYFEFFEDDIKSVFLKEHEFLFELNKQSLQSILDILRVKVDISYTTEYKSTIENSIDLRSSISPKEKSRMEFPAYYQPFSERNGFIANASVLDLLFNEGLGALSYLKKLNF